MRYITLILALLLSSSGYASTCYVQRNVYACSNASGTSCTKTAISVMIPDLATPIASCNYQMLSSGEYSQLIANSTNISNVASLVTGVEVRASNLETRTTNLENRASTLETAYNNMVSTVNALSTTVTQSAGAVAGLTSQLNVPFDLNTALAATAFFFTTILFFYGVSKGAGAVLAVIRRSPRGL